MANELGKLLIRADAGGHLGTGHVMRCMALAQAWCEAGGEALFTVASLPEALEARLTADGIRVHRLCIEAGSDRDATETVRLAAEVDARWMVLDGYQFDAAFQDRIKESSRPVLVVDDYCHAGRYSADIVLNQNLQAHATLYTRLGPTTRLLLGLQYLLLRREFWPWRGWQRDLPAQARRVLVTMGGIDPDNVTGKILQAVSLMLPPHSQVVVVVGAGNPNRSALEATTRSMPGVEVRCEVRDMPGLMAWADVAVSAAGSTTWELAFTGLPALVLALADNQAPTAAALERHGLAKSLGDSATLTPQRVAAALTELLSDAPRRAEMSMRGQMLVDGCGAQRVVAAICERATSEEPRQRTSR